MATQKRSTKKALKALLFIGGFLILALIGAVVYFYVIEDIQQTDKQKDQITCGCYIIDPAVIKDCGDPKKAIFFSTKTVASDQACSASCNTQLLSEHTLNSTTAVDRYKSCTVRSISDARCNNMLLTNQNGEVITGRINPEDEVNVEAEFDSDKYKNHTFKINTEDISPSKIEGNKIYTTIKNFKDADSLDILATAKDSKGDSINSIICRRVIEIKKEGGVNANAMTVTTERQSDGTTRISQIIITVGQLTNENVKINFSFGNKYPTLTMQDGFNIESSKGTISITKANLYDTSNFTGEQTFAILDQHVGELIIGAEVFANEQSIGVVTTTTEFIETKDPIVEQPTPPVEEDKEKSNFLASKSVAPVCIERVENKNIATFTISVKNNSNTIGEISSIKDKLPLGFRYVEGSSTINGTNTPDNGVVTVANIGSTQEIVWQQNTPWSITSSGQLVIIFKALADSSALTGENLNEVIVNPVLIPANPTTLRAEAIINVAQDCNNISQKPDKPTTPSTGILDNTYTRIAIGIILFFTAWIIYTKPEGTKLSKIILDSGIYRDVRMTKYKLTNPKKYFEEKVIQRKKEKKI